MGEIVVGVDESDGAAVALRWALEHGRRHQLPVTVLMAWSVRDQHPLDPDASFDPRYGHEQAQRDLHAIVARAVRGPTPAVRYRAVSGGPATTLVDASAHASLVVVGARGIGGFTGLLVGSVSREVLNRSLAPVVVVGATTPQPDGPVVVGIDGSATARRALGWALADARVSNRVLVALHAWQIARVGDGHPTSHLSATALRRDAAALLDREITQADTSGVAVEARVVERTPAAALVEASSTASVVVVGSRGHRPLTGLLLGSVNDQVAHHAQCPVVVVPPSAPDVGG